MPVRYDIGDLKRPRVTPQGFLRVDAFITRSGIFEYRQPDGTVRKELRDPAHVFDAESLESFAMAPVTDDHPDVMLTPENAREYARGTLGESVKRDGNKVRASMLITDAALVAKMQEGKRQVSCGYTCDLDMTPGEWQGKKYDAVQRNIRANHVAVVDVGRAGPAVCARMDAADACMTDTDFKETVTMKTIVIDGVAYLVNEADADKLTAKVGAIQARADAAEATLAQERKARTDADAAIPAQVAARVLLEKLAAKHGVEKCDGLTDREVKVAVVEKLSKTKLDAKATDAYVEAYFDIAVGSAGSNAAAQARSVADAASKGAQETETRADAGEARAKARVELANRWKNPIPGAVTTVAEGE